MLQKCERLGRLRTMSRQNPYKGFCVLHTSNGLVDKRADIHAVFIDHGVKLGGGDPVQTANLALDLQVLLFVVTRGRAEQQRVQLHCHILLRKVQQRVRILRQHVCNHGVYIYDN